MFTELSCEAGDGVLRAGGTRLAPTEPAGETGPIGSEVLPAYKKTLRVYPEGFLIQQVMGIEPTYPAWKAGVLPLNYTCAKLSLYYRGFGGLSSRFDTNLTPIRLLFYGLCPFDTCSLKLTHFFSYIVTGSMYIQIHAIGEEASFGRPLLYSLRILYQ